MTKILVIHKDSVEEIDMNTESNGYASKIVGGFPRFFGCWTNDLDGVYLLGPSTNTYEMNPEYLQTVLPQREEGYEHIYGPLVLTKLEHRNTLGDECNDPVDFGMDEYDRWISTAE